MPPDARKIMVSPRLLPDPQVLPAAAVVQQQPTSVILQRSSNANQQRAAVRQRPGAAATAVAAAAAPAATAAGQIAARAALSKEDERLRQLLLGDIVESSPHVTFADIAGLKLAKQALQEAVILPT